MPSTYTLIASNVLSASAASVTFSAIPSTYTDLVMRGSVRCDDSASATLITMRLNGGATTDVSVTRLYGDGSGANSNRTTVTTGASIFDINGAASTSNTFANIEIYIPNYTVAAAKPISAMTAQENNVSSPATIGAHAILFNNTAAVTSLTFLRTGQNLLSGSSFYLYGISKS